MNKKSHLSVSISLGWLLTVVAFFLGIIGAIYLNNLETSISIPIAANNLPPYHQILDSDLNDKKVSTRNLPPKIFKQRQEIIGRYTLTNIFKQEPLKKDKLGSLLAPSLISNTVVFAIPATPTLILGGTIERGDFVDIALIPKPTKKQTVPEPINFNDILVLDIKPASSNQVNNNLSSELVLIIAIPQQRQQEFTKHITQGKLLITRRL